MYIIGPDEAEDIAEKVKAIIAFKYCKDIGYSMKNTNISLSSGYFDPTYLKERIICGLLDILVGDKNYTSYQASTDDGEKVGYELYYDEDELSVNAFMITDEYISKWMKVLKRHSIDVYTDGVLADLANRIRSKEWYGDYDLTDGMLGLDYSGIYMLTTYYSVDFIDFIDAIDDIKKYCKKMYMKYHKGEEIILGNNLRGETAKLKKPKKKRKRSWEKRNEWKDRLIDKRIGKMLKKYNMSRHSQ